MAEVMMEREAATSSPQPTQAPPQHTTEDKTPASSGELAALSTGPLDPTSITLKGEGSEITLGTGLYLVLGGAGVGKSVTTIGLVALASLTKATAAGHLYFFEVGAPTYPPRDEIAMFSDPRRFLEYGKGGDLEQYLHPILANRSRKDKPIILSLDSIGTQLRAFLSEERTRMTASEGGQQPADRMFVERLDALGVAKSIVFLGVTNTELVPFAEKLYGATQGLIVAQSASTFTKSDRVTGRRSVQHQIPQNAVTIALRTMGYLTKKGEAAESLTY